ncbi:hypothetical protein LGL55_07260 [Clostridium tagluense]|uniref:hypothetical protein n=1 Tax=Clostridium TaxID=1485 RepID=UPI0013E96B8E|nr:MULTISPECIES: hypothetical protein [Clostridium]MBW9157321.1 hypothetical protein [Clostridium tagluense]MBZ9623461.1 hypothetical protein [Clostridium sp. FP2]MCB2310873.1 hypothetical protein [Clostridium tagluense]MCB2315727.1 hypothetical protein [Clostridium tagluense]MCB2320629.1 hypothetical protein [Clostridium tagluense]
MDRKTYYILGTIFLISSAFLYEIERGIAYYSWIGQMSAHTGSYSTNPQLPSLFTNIYIPIFLIIGVVFYVLAYRKRNRNNS